MTKHEVKGVCSALLVVLIIAAISYGMGAMGDEPVLRELTAEEAKQAYPDDLPEVKPAPKIEVNTWNVVPPTPPKPYLPDPYNRVLVHCERGYVIGYHNGDGNWYCVPLDNNTPPARLVILEPKHWMRLPEVPAANNVKKRIQPPPAAKQEYCDPRDWQGCN